MNKSDIRGSHSEIGAIFHRRLAQVTRGRCVLVANVSTGRALISSVQTLFCEVFIGVIFPMLAPMELLPRPVPALLAPGCELLEPRGMRRSGGPGPNEHQLRVMRS